MTKALLKNGVFEPLEPLPADWQDEVDVEKASPDHRSLTADEWKAAMDRAALELDPADENILRDAIAEIRVQAKELARQGRM